MNKIRLIFDGKRRKKKTRKIHCIDECGLGIFCWVLSCFDMAKIEMRIGEKMKINLFTMNDRDKNEKKRKTNGTVKKQMKRKREFQGQLLLNQRRKRKRSFSL